MRSTADLRPDRTAGCVAEPFPAPLSSQPAASNWARRPPVLNTAHASHQPPDPESWNDPAPVTYVHFQLLGTVVS